MTVYPRRSSSILPLPQVNAAAFIHLPSERSSPVSQALFLRRHAEEGCGDAILRTARLYTETLSPREYLLFFCIKRLLQILCLACKEEWRMSSEEVFQRRLMRHALLKEAATSGIHWFLIAIFVVFGTIRVSEASLESGAGDPVIGSAPQNVEEVLVAEPDDLVVEPFVENLEIPWDLVFLPGGRAFVTERPGRIRLISGGRLAEKPYAVIDTASIGEGGLMGLAVHPDYPGRPYLYIMYTYRIGTRIYNKVVRLRDDGSSAVEDMIIAERIPGYRVHDGGRIAFGPDNMLYVCTGDAGQATTAQNIQDLRGKILRYAPDGSIPRDNPFPGSPVYAYGLRNPQGLAWHPQTGDLFCSDHGPSGEFGLFGNDSINVIVKGGNYGWPLVLGDVDMEAYEDPVVFWPRATPPAGMTFFGGKLYTATLRGESLIRISLDKEDDDYEVRSIERLFATDWFRGTYGRIRQVTAGPDGSLYILTSNRDGRGTPRKGDDKILRIRFQR